MKTVVEVKNLTKKFSASAKATAGKGYFLAVDNVSFSIKKGQIIGLLGPNGAGKTTTIAMLLGLIKPTSGSIEIFGKNIETHRSEILQNLNFASTYTEFRKRMTVYENLYVFSLLYDVKNPKERIDKTLETFEVGYLRNRLVMGLSSGEITRLGLCKALINYPNLLLLDEPTASLDPNIAQKTRDFLFKIRRKHTVSMLYTSHNMAEIAQMCDWVIFLNKGKIVVQDTPLNLTKMVSDCTLNLIFDAQLDDVINFAKKHQLNFLIPQPHNLVIKLTEEKIAQVLTSLARSKIKIVEIDIKKPNLEDVFLKITRNNSKQQ